MLVQEMDISLKAAQNEDLFSFFQERFENHYVQHEINEFEYEQTLKSFQKGLKLNGRGTFDNLAKEYSEVISTTIITSFGLGPFFHSNDQKGGSVTTVHNAKNGIYSNEKDKYNRGEYEYSQGRTKTLKKSINENGLLKDGYTGKITLNAHVDHIVPLEDFHKNGGFMLNAEAKRNFSNDERNLIVTDEKLNLSKGAKNLNVFMSSKIKGSTIDNKQRFKMDKRRTNAAANRANNARDEHSPDNVTKVKYYVDNGGIAASKEAVTMGMRQAVGMVMHILTTELFNELIIYAKQFSSFAKEQTLIVEFKVLVERVKEKVISQLKNLMTTFSEGFVSGFLSNILTTIINSFITTSKRGGRIIREGFLSIVKAVRLLLFPQADMSDKERYREAIKLFISGLLVSGGIILEEALEKKLINLNLSHSIASAVATTVTGILTGVAIVTVVHMLDIIISDLPSTRELIASSNELLIDSETAATEYSAVVANLRHDNESFIDRINGTESNVKELINFFEE